MKKLILIFITLFVGFSVYAQDTTETRTMSKDQTLYYYIGTAADTFGTTVTNRLYQMNANKNKSLYSNIEMKIDTTTTIDGTVQKDFVLQGRIFSSDSWTDIEEKADQDVTAPLTLDWYSTTFADVDSLSTNNVGFYRQYRVLIRDGTDVSGLDAGEQFEVEYIYWKFYER